MKFREKWAKREWLGLDLLNPSEAAEALPIESLLVRWGSTLQTEPYSGQELVANNRHVRVCKFLKVALKWNLLGNI